MNKTGIKNFFKEMIVNGGRELLAEKLTVGTWGNLSVRDAETGLIYTKPSGMDYNSITIEDIVVFDSQYNIVDGFRKPTIEYRIHIEVLKSRADINCVIHTHPVYSSVLGVLGEDLPGITEDFVQIVGDKIINCDYALPGTEALSKNVVKALGQRNAAIIPNHGTVCCGKDWKTVKNVCYVVEKTAQIYILAKSIGLPKVIKEEDILSMQEFVKNHYGQGK